MDVLSLLKEEDDNPRGRGGATEASGRVHQGATLDEAAAVEAARQEAKERRIPLREQEAGILHLLQAKSLFARLRLPEPHYDADGKLLWTPPGDLVLRRVYDDLSRWCAPDVSQHPKREEGFAKLSEAYDTISNKNGRRDAYVAERVAELRRLEQLREQVRREAEEKAAESSAASSPRPSGQDHREPWRYSGPRGADSPRAQAMARQGSSALARSQALPLKPSSSSSASASAPASAAASASASAKRPRDWLRGGGPTADPDAVVETQAAVSSIRSKLSAPKAARGPAAPPRGQEKLGTHSAGLTAERLKRSQEEHRAKMEAAGKPVPHYRK